MRWLRLKFHTTQITVTLLLPGSVHRAATLVLRSLAILRLRPFYCPMEIVPAALCCFFFFPEIVHFCGNCSPSSVGTLPRLPSPSPQGRTRGCKGEVSDSIGYWYLDWYLNERMRDISPWMILRNGWSGGLVKDGAIMPGGIFLCPICVCVCPAATLISMFLWCVCVLIVGVERTRERLIFLSLRAGERDYGPVSSMRKDERSCM